MASQPGIKITLLDVPAVKDILSAVGYVLEAWDGCRLLVLVPGDLRTALDDLVAACNEPRTSDGRGIRP